MVEIKVPDEFLMDPEVNSLHQQYKQLIQTFKTTHQQTIQLRESTQDPEEIKQRLLKMEREKDQLKVKNEEMTKKMRELSVSRTTCFMYSCSLIERLGCLY